MTTELTIAIDNSLMETIGKSEIEKSLQEWLVRLQLKAAAKDVLDDLAEFDLTNDPQWQVARELAWKQEEAKYLTQ